MIAESVYIRGHTCFKSEWAGFSKIHPINVIIGRNNSGKSHLLDLVKTLCHGRLGEMKWSWRCQGVLDKASLERIFPVGGTGSALSGDYWHDHGAHFNGHRVTWEIDSNFDTSSLDFDDLNFDPGSGKGPRTAHERIVRLKQLVSEFTHQLRGKVFRHILADRDIRSEPAKIGLHLSPDGAGATNIIRRYIVTSKSDYPREVIQRTLLRDLNAIFSDDGVFTEIQVKEHDEANAGGPQGHWEIFLGEEQKGLVPLSRSGSGLKTVILVLLNLLVIPEIEKKAKSEFSFAFEELENNLHPALLRRLFRYLENYAVREGAKIFLTTHSSVALDVFGISKNAGIIRVTHDGKEAKAQTVAAHFDRLGVISELGVKPSDLLQANGIIWVEGPSDCIYLNRWIDLLAKGELQEGRDYQCAFYGGSLLARTQFSSPEAAEGELVNLFRVNSNIVVVCDGDRTAKGKRVKDRVRRISSEVKKIPGAHIWVTDGREIENYCPGVVLSEALELTNLPDPDQYELFFPRKGSPNDSYVEKRMNRKGVDKMDLAVLTVPRMNLEMMRSRFDWHQQMSNIVERIRAWNR